ncbi:MAG: PASTA domain-containing protein [Paludibacter sp.]|nr:PASTA domain-containing protein [Paludibacter sp.]
MDFKTFWKESLAGFILIRLIIAAVIFVALAWGTLIAIDYYTHHGEAETVPDLKGLYVEEAEIMLANHGLYPQVIDSVYTRDKKLGTIVEQIPAANSTVKQHRPIYLIINSKQIRKIPLPEVNDVSFRQASAVLQAIGLNVTNVEYAPSEYKDLVISVKYRGQAVSAGTRIPEGSPVVLVVGSGLSSGQAVIPSVKGMNIEDARQQAILSSMVIGAVEYDVQPSGDESDYVVYKQSPAAGKSVPAGTRIDVWLSKDKSLLNKTYDDEESDSNSDSEEEFF